MQTPYLWLVGPKPSVGIEGTRQGRVCLAQGQWSEVNAFSRDGVAGSPGWGLGKQSGKCGDFFFLPRKGGKDSHMQWEVLRGDYGFQRLKIKQEERAPLGGRSQLHMGKTHVNFFKAALCLFLSPAPWHQTQFLAIFKGAVGAYTLLGVWEAFARPHVLLCSASSPSFLSPVFMALCLLFWNPTFPSSSWVSIE